MKLNRLDLYLGIGVVDGIKMVDSWGNRKQYEDDTPEDHFIRNMNGWIGEEIFKATFSDWQYMDEDDHIYLTESKPGRKGLPDFKNATGTLTCEVKTYYNLEYLEKKIDWWKRVPGELHNADIVMVFVREGSKSGKWYKVDINNWTYKLLDIKVRYPIWFRGFITKINWK